MDILGTIWVLVGVLIFGTYLIFIVPIPTIITAVTMLILWITVMVKKAAIKKDKEQ